jgi:hypothetical protein
MQSRNIIEHLNVLPNSVSGIGAIANANARLYATQSRWNADTIRGIAESKLNLVVAT